MGFWSYPVPEFEWEHFSFGKNFSIKPADYRAKGYDLIFMEDGGNWGNFYGSGGCPVVYHAIDSTLSDEHHYSPRFVQAQKADLILVEHDRLFRFNGGGVPTYQFRYCVNDLIFRDWKLPKDIDVAFHCNSGHAMPDTTRSNIRNTLHEICKKHGLSYSSGTLGVGEYARRLNRAKIVVNWPRTPYNRPHRVYDAMASRACLLTGPLPAVGGEAIASGVHYSAFENVEQLETLILFMLQNNNWMKMGEKGYQWATQQNWATRARELRNILHTTLNL